MKKPDKQVQEFWDKVLHDHGLGMSRADGSSKADDKGRRVVYVGGLDELEVIIKKEGTRKLTGKRRPEGHRPD